MSISTRQKHLVQESFTRLLPLADRVTVLFYDHLCTLDSSLPPSSIPTPSAKDAA